MTTSDILKAAKARLTPETWARSTDEVVFGGKECVLSAIGVAGYALNGPVDSTIDLMRLVVTGKRNGWPARWNDAPERTFQDVMDAFDAAIAIAESQEQVADGQLVKPS